MPASKDANPEVLPRRVWLTGSLPTIMLLAVTTGLVLMVYMSALALRSEIQGVGGA